MGVRESVGGAVASMLGWLMILVAVLSPVAPVFGLHKVELPTVVIFAFLIGGMVLAFFARVLVVLDRFSRAKIKAFGAEIDLDGDDDKGDGNGA